MGKAVRVLGLALWRGFSTWRGLAVAFGVILGTAVTSGFATGALFDLVSNLAGWDTLSWPELPEVIPPNGWL